MVHAFTILRIDVIFPYPKTLDYIFLQHNNIPMNMFQHKCFLKNEVSVKILDHQKDISRYNLIIQSTEGKSTNKLCHFLISPLQFRLLKTYLDSGQ